MFLIPEPVTGQGSMGKTHSQDGWGQLVSGSQRGRFEQVAPACGPLTCTPGFLQNGVESVTVYS